MNLEAVQQAAETRRMAEADYRSPCILSSRYVSRSGYVYVRRADGSQARHHRHVWEACFGAIPAGFDVHHRCEVKRCINPEHLALVAAGDHRWFHVELRRLREPKRTHCRRGHPLEGENLFHDSHGRPNCRTCRNARALAWYYRQKAKP